MRHLLASTLILSAMLWGCGGDSTGPDHFDLNGEWSGTTSQSKPISFTVTGSGITSVTVGFRTENSFCSSEGSMTSTFSQPLSISNNSFTLSMGGGGPGSTSISGSGTFNSQSSASGNLQFSNDCGSASATWSATKR